MVCHVAGNGHPCPHCNINFRTKDDVAQHVLKQHSGGQTATSDTVSRPSISSLQRQQDQRILQQYQLNEQPRAQNENKVERYSISNENRGISQKILQHKFTGDTAGQQEQEILDDEEEMEIPAPDQLTHSISEDHFILQGNPVTSSAPQTNGGALPQLSLMPSASSSGNKGGMYTCSICMESFDKVGLLNNHIRFKHSKGGT